MQLYRCFPPALLLCSVVSLQAQCPPTTQPSYCPALGDVCFQGLLRHYVSFVSFGTINNVTQIVGPLCPPGFTGYSNFRHVVGTVARGSNVLITVGIDVASRYGLTGQVRVYIDWNGNRSFDDAGEAIDIPLFNGNQNPWIFQATIRIPPTAVDHTIMRVGFSHPGPNPPCGNFYGDCEDYTIVVQGGTGAGFQVNQPSARLHLDGREGTPYCYHGVQVQAPSTVTVSIGTSLTAPSWCIGLSPQVPTPSSVGGIRTANGQHWNLRADSSLIVIGGFTAIPAAIPVPVLTPTLLSMQAVVLDAAQPDGFALTQPIALTVR